MEEYIKSNTIRLEASRRGGGIEIDASEFTGIEGAKMTAYQNYLGGGMLGSIQGDRNFKTKNFTQEKKATKLHDELKRYFHHITNEEAGEYDEWNAGEFEAIQERPASAY